MVNQAYKKIYAVVRQIPPGRVATYGQVARLAGLQGQARLVGYALSALNDNDVPWHRVINSKGEISPRANPDYQTLQRDRLEEEGIVFLINSRVPLDKFCWKR